MPNRTYQRTEALEVGIYEGRITDITDEMRNAYQSEEKEQCLVFSLEIQTDNGNTRRKKYYPMWLGPNTKLVKDLRSLAPTKATPEVFADDKLVDNLVDSLIGTRCMVQIGRSKTDREKIESLSGMRGKTTPGKARPSSKAELDGVLDGDDVTETSIDLTDDGAREEDDIPY